MATFTFSSYNLIIVNMIKGQKEEINQIFKEICIWNSASTESSGASERQPVYRKWSEKENAQYVSFIRGMPEIFETEYHRRAEKSFHQMHKEISTRTAEQCRSHHQKKIQRHGTIEEIVRDYEVTKEKKERKQAEEAGRFKRKRRTKAQILADIRKVEEANRTKKMEIKVNQRQQVEDFGQELDEDSRFQLEIDFLDNVSELSNSWLKQDFFSKFQASELQYKGEPLL